MEAAGEGLRGLQTEPEAWGVSDETRRPSDTVPLDREAIKREMLRAADTSPPPPILAAIAEAQLGVELEVCPCCGVGMVDAKRAARARLAMPQDPGDEPEPVTSVGQ